MDTSKFGDIIKFAIAREETAYKTYGEMSEKAETPGLKDLLLELQAEEKNHKKLLQDITETGVDNLETHEVIDLKISDYLTEEPPTPDMSFQDLLIHAAKKEQEAVDLYSNMKEAIKSDDLKKLFDFLIEQEKTHKLKLETEYEKHVLDEG
ncbi:MAG: ferritin family protein [Candidatus Aminicenantes bacterium]